MSISCQCVHCLFQNKDDDFLMECEHCHLLFCEQCMILCDTSDKPSVLCTACPQCNLDYLTCQGDRICLECILHSEIGWCQTHQKLTVLDDNERECLIIKDQEIIREKCCIIFPRYQSCF